MTADMNCAPGIALILWLCASMATAVCGVMLYSIARFGSAQDAVLTQTHRKTAEVLWASVPILILLGAAVPAVKALTTPAACVADSGVAPVDAVASGQL